MCACVSKDQIWVRLSVKVRVFTLTPQYTVQPVKFHELQGFDFKKRSGLFFENAGPPESVDSKKSKSMRKMPPTQNK